MLCKFDFHKYRRPLLFVGVTSRTNSVNTKTADNKGPLPWWFYALSGLKTSKIRKKRWKYPQITNFVHNLKAVDNQNSE